ncbi:MAG: hypothetical protein Q8Q49_01540 [bacterium]|nr:hypothetical protein [bacterium]
MEEKEGKKTASDSSVSFLQGKRKWFDSLPKLQKILVVFAGIGLLFIFYIISVLVRYDDSSISSSPIDSDLAENRFESFPLEEAGLVCFGDNRFSFRIDSPYRVLSDEKNGVAIFAGDSMVTVSINGKSLVERLKDFGIAYTQEADVYFYKVLLNKNATGGENTSYGVSQEKNGSVASVFSFKKDDKEALQVLAGVVDSLKEGCYENK